MIKALEHWTWSSVVLVVDDNITYSLTCVHWISIQRCSVASCLVQSLYRNDYSVLCILSLSLFASRGNKLVTDWRLFLAAFDRPYSCGLASSFHVHVLTRHLQLLLRPTFASKAQLLCLSPLVPIVMVAGYFSNCFEIKCWLFTAQRMPSAVYAFAEISKNIRRILFGDVFRQMDTSRQHIER